MRMLLREHSQWSNRPRPESRVWSYETGEPVASPILFGKYHLIEKISAGGMAEVFKAKSYGVAGFEKLLVIKKILPHLNTDREFIEMFLDEARISVSLSHGNIVQVIDLGKETDTYFMAMEYVHGFDLARVLVRSKQSVDLSLGLTLFILGEVLKALDYAHRRRDREQRELNIVHCDVSPQNVLLSYEGEVKLADFGISKAAFQSVASREVVRGKYAYMSPEQVRGRPLDRRSDIFAVGVLLWEMLTGRRLFKTDNVEKTLKKVLEDPIVAPSSLVSSVPPELDRITLKALTRDREQRYQEDQEMLDDLYAFMFSQGLMATGADLSTYLKETFAAEWQKSRGDEIAAGDSARVHKMGAKEVRWTPYIPMGSSRTIPSHKLDVAAGPGASLQRVGVAVLVAEWNPSRHAKSTIADRHKLLLGLSERFQRRIEQAGGELWEVNHNSLVAVWRLEDPIASAMQAAVDTALGLADELRTDSDDQAPPQGVLDVGLHAGAVIVERRTGHPLHGWQVTRTFALPRLLVNLNSLEGRVLVTQPARKLVGEAFGFAPHLLPGRAQSALPETFVATRIAAEPITTLKFSPFTRYLGRDALLTALRERVQDAADGKGSVVLLQGREGNGRSRLREELRESCRARGCAFFTSQSQPDARAFAYASFLDILRRICGILWAESVDSERRKLSRLIELGVSQEELEVVQKLFEEPLPGVERVAEPQRQAHIFALFDKIVAGLSKDAPMVLSFGDFQHADVLTEAWLNHVLNLPASRRMVVLLEVPPDYRAAWLQGIPVHAYTVEPLPPSLVIEMIKDMVGVTSVTQDLLAQVVRLTDGNPLLVKELVGNLVEDGLLVVTGRQAGLQASPPLTPGPAGEAPRPRAGLPESPLELLARRFARATEDVRAVLKAGAVLGTYFSPVILARILPAQDGLHESLQKAVALGILKERPLDGTAYFRFRHSYYRSLALQDPTGEPTRAVYRRLVEQLPTWKDFGRGNRIERLAVAAFRGGTLDAAPALERAGDKLSYEQGLSSSLVFYRRALEVARSELQGMEALRRRVRWKIASALLHQGLLSDSESLLENGVESALRAGSEPEAAAMLLELGQQHLQRGELERAIHVLREAYTLARKGESVSRLAEVERELGRALQQLGRIDEAIHFLRSGYQRARMLEDMGLVLAHAQAIGCFFQQVGDSSRALDSLRKVFSAALERKDPDRILSVLPDLGQLLYDNGHEEMALKFFREALNLARALEDPAAQAIILGQLGAVFLAGGHSQRAYPCLKAAIELAATLPRPTLQLGLRVDFAWLRAMTSDPRAALRELQALLSRPESLRQPLLVTRAHFIAGHCYWKAGEPVRAKESFERSLRFARELKNAPIVERTARALQKVSGG